MQMPIAHGTNVGHRLHFTAALSMPPDCDKKLAFGESINVYQLCVNVFDSMEDGLRLLTITPAQKQLFFIG